jgi:putative membrane protein
MATRNSALTFAAKRSFVRHRKVTRVLAPLWLYVSVTGVSVFFFLRQWGLPH